MSDSERLERLQTERPDPGPITELVEQACLRYEHGDYHGSYKLWQ